MKHYFFLFCVLFISVSVSAQYSGFQYHKIPNKLHLLLYILQDTGKYLSEFEKLAPDSLWEEDLFMACRVYAQKKDYEKFRKYSKYCFEKGQVTATFSNLISNLPDHEERLLFEYELNARERYFSKVPQELYHDIQRMANTDAKLRDMYTRNLIDLSVIRDLDSINLTSLKSIISKHGMLTHAKHGALFHKLFYLLIHCFYYDEKDYEWMRKLWYKTVMEGKNDPNSYAYYVDRWQAIINKETIYGSFIEPGDPGLKYTIPTKYDLKNINLRRKEIGLCPIEDWLLIQRARKFLPDWQMELMRRGKTKY